MKTQLTSDQNSMQNNYHLIRFVAASLVLYGHCYPLLGRGNNDYLTVASRGIFPTSHMGVCIFFVVSGFLVSQSLQNSKNVADFIWKRIVRIFPGLIISLMFCVFVIGTLCTTLPLSHYLQSTETYRYFKILKLYPYFSDRLPGVFENLPEKSVNGPLWTLAYEITMYLFLVFLQIIGVFSKRNMVLILCLIAFPVVNYLIFTLSSVRQIPILHLSTTEMLEFGIFFMMGTLLNLFKDKIPYTFPYFLLMIVVWFGLGYFRITQSITIKIISFFSLPYIVIYLANLKGKINDFGKMGDLSYGIYIYAFPVQQTITYFSGVTISVFNLFISSASIVLVLSILSWHLIEKNALKFKKFPFLKYV
jgi:peptidoglycan/LPS O-acetylase OafA/YrhL